MKVSFPNEDLQNMIRQEVEKITFTEDEVFFDGRKQYGSDIARITSALVFSEDPAHWEICSQALERAKFYMCHFTPFLVSKILFEHGHKLSQAAQAVIHEYLHRIRHEYVDNELDFVGVNDNFPFMSTYTACAFWQFYRVVEMVATARRRFGQLERMLKRRGCISEFNSMTYTPVQLVAVAAVQRIAPDEECRRIALQAQHRIWADCLAHYHPQVGSWSGPFSRHYIGQSQGIFAFVPALVELKVDVLRETYGLGGLHHLTEEYDIPDAAWKLVTDKQYPFTVTCTSEYTASTDATPEAARRDMTKEEECYEYGAGVAGLYTYQTARYGIGTSTHEWHNGVQATTFFVNYRRNDVPKVRSDARQVYCRYLLNDETVADQRFFDQGRKLAFGRENQALVLYKPKIAWIPSVDTGNCTEDLAAHYRRQEISGNLGVTSAKLLIMIPLNGVKPEKILLGEEALVDCAGKSQSPRSVYIQDGDMYLAFHPTQVDDLGRDCAMTVRLRGDNLEIALYNYAGEKKDFARRHFLHVRNGFLFSAGSAEECGSFESFLAREKQTVIEDRMITSNHARQTFIRQVDAVTAQRKLSCEYAPASESIKFLACDDYALEFPKLEISDLDVKELPLM